MRVFLLFIILVIKIPVFCQYDYVNHDTLYNKYAVSYKDVLIYQRSYAGFGKQDFAEKYYYSEDTLLDGNFFFSFGVCLSNNQSPFYFIKISFLQIIDNSFYDFEKPIKLTVTLVNDNNVLDGEKKIIATSGNKEELGSIKYMGLELKNNSNIFKLTSTDFINLFTYKIQDISINQIGNNSSIGANGRIYNLSGIINKFKNSVTVSSF